MSRDYADKDFLRYRSPRKPKRNWLKWLLFLFAFMAIIYLFHGRLSFMENTYQRVAAYFKENKAHVQRKVSDMIPAMPKPPNEDDIHFAFYDTLPALQVKSIQNNHAQSAGVPPPPSVSPDTIKEVDRDPLSLDASPHIAHSVSGINKEEGVFHTKEEKSIKMPEINKTEKIHQEQDLQIKHSEIEPVSEDALSAEFSQHMQARMKQPHYQILLAVFNTEVAARSYRDRLPFGNKVNIVREQTARREQYRVFISGLNSEQEAKSILQKYQRAGWAKQGQIQVEKG